MATWGEYYHRTASQMALFRDSSRRLVELAELRPGMAVLDLASGSGLAALAALDAVPEGLKLYLLDSDPTMIEAAKAQIGDRAAVYHVADAEAALDLIDEKLDRVLCNLSFWYFPRPEAVLRKLRGLIKPLGRLCFNLSGTYFNTGGGVVSPQWALTRLLHQRGDLPRALPEVERLPNQRSIEGTLMQSGFKPFRYDLLEIESPRPETEPGGELYNLLKLYPVLPGGTHQEAVARSHAALPSLAGAIEAMQPRWRTVTFLAQPQISPEEAIMLKFNRMKG